MDEMNKEQMPAQKPEEKGEYKYQYTTKSGTIERYKTREELDEAIEADKEK